jgi:hypothetical protein
MSALYLVANSGSQALAANTAETVLQLTAAANHRIRILGLSLTIAGTSPLDITLRVLRQSTAGTSGTSVTPVKVEPAAAETIQTSAATNFSAEPTAGDVLMYKRLQGSYEMIYPLGQEVIVAGSGRIGVEVTCTAIATVAAELRFEE